MRIRHHKDGSTCDDLGCTRVHVAEERRADGDAIKGPPPAVDPKADDKTSRVARRG